MLPGDRRLESGCLWENQPFLFRGQVPGGPILGREAKRQNSGFGFREFERRVIFPGPVA